MTDSSWSGGPEQPDFTPRPPGGWIDPQLPPMSSAPQRLAGRGIPASFSARAVATLVDSAVLCVPLWLIVQANGGSFPLPLSAALTNQAIQLVYFATLEGITGATLGKALVGIRVIDALTDRPGPGVLRGVSRYVARLFSAAVCLLGYLSMLTDRRRRTWHDRMTGTRVVRW